MDGPEPTKTARPKLSPEHEEVLRRAAAEPAPPGTILADFEAMLAALQPPGLESAGKHHLLPMSRLTELNARLTRPLEHKLKRPQQRSYPNLQGLYLLLRATGLVRVTGSGPKVRLEADPEVQASWQRLNPWERYFTLLETWLHHAREDILGEGHGRELLLVDVVNWHWERIPAKGRRFNPREQDNSGMQSRLYHLALLEMFGAVEIEAGKTPKGAWCPLLVRRRPWGDALLALFRATDFDTLFGLGEEADLGGTPRFGAWQPIFAPYVTQWQQNLEIPAPPFREGVHVFRISLGEVWRLLAVGARHDLELLAAGILRAFRFDFDHLYDFSYVNRFGMITSINSPEDETGPFAPEVEVGAVPLAPGDSMTFHFDYGDDWRFDVKLERLDPPDPKLRKPRVLESHGKAPAQYGDDGW